MKKLLFCSKFTKLIGVLIICSSNLFGQTISEINKTLPQPYANTNNLNAYYGHKISIDGNYAVVGSYGHDASKGCAYVLYFDGTNWTTQGLLTASDATADDRLGYSVGISGDVIVIGATYDDDNGDKSGSAYVFEKPAGGWTNLTETAKLTSSDGAINDYFGNSIAISGDVIVVGAYGDDDNGGSSGSVYVFEKPGTNWTNMTQTAKLTSSDGASFDNFGWDISISGDVIAVGANGDDDNGNSSGSVYVFEKPGANWTSMSQTAKLTASDGADTDRLGGSVSISGDVIAAGAYCDDDNGSNSGSAYIFEKPGANWTNMTQTAKLSNSDGVADDYFAYSVSIHGDVLVVGAYGDDDNGASSGSAYIFEKPGTNWATMTQTAKINSSDGSSNDEFGKAVAICGDLIIAGAAKDDDNGSSSGSAYAFEKQGSNWINATEDNKIVAQNTLLTNAGDNYGLSASSGGNYAVIGSPGYDMNKGCAYVLFFDGNNWITQARLTADDGLADDSFGQSVYMDGDVIAIGAHYDDDNGSNSGAVYVFEKPGANWTDMTQTAKLTASDGVSNDYLGYSVCISGNVIAAGAYGDDDNALNSGSAYIFEKSGLNWTNMTQTAKLNASDADAQDKFSKSISISGDVIVVGSEEDDDNAGNSGSAYVFEKPGINWVDMTQTAKLTASDGAADDKFGKSVSIANNVIVVGAIGDDDNGNNNGSAYVFEKPSSNWINMTQSAKLTASNATTSNYFGSSLSIYGNTIIVGANGGSTGYAYAFEKSGSNWTNMTQTTELIASDGETGDYFGSTVSIFGDAIIVGAYGDDDNGSNSGSAYFYNYCTPSFSTDIQFACDSYTWIDGNTYTESNNTATFTLTNAAGCDSIVTLDLSIGNNTSIDIQTACDTYTWIDGNTYTSSNNTATYTLTNAIGCDSAVTLNLTINNSTESTDTHTACNSFTWIDGNTYTESNNSATYIIQNAAGCDSVISLDLTINYSSESTDTHTACDSFTWIDGNTYTESNNSATYIIPNAAGCDSVISLDLTINYSSESTDTHTACDSFTWIDGNTYTESNNSATHIITNAAGCDSVISLDLTVNYSSESTDTHTACDSFTWIDGNTYTESNNSATYIIPNAAGCDSVITLDLTVNYSTESTDTHTACDSFTWIDGNTYTESNNSATHTIPNVAGCDSVITLDLTINTVDVSVSQNGFTLTANESSAYYQWIDCANNNIPIEGETNQSFTASENGYYAVIVDNGLCIDTSICYTIEGIGINETANSSFNIYPNPTNGLVTVEGKDIERIEVFSLEGTKLKDINVIDKKTVFDLSIYAKGIYFIRVFSNKKPKIKRIVRK